MKNIINEPKLETFIKEELELDMDFAMRIFSIFKKYVKELQDEGFNGSDENIENMRLMAHKLKSSCISFGAEPLAERLEELEQAATNKNLNSVQALYINSTELTYETVRSLEVLLKTILERGQKSP
jgi:HPt (histidine-containing phosphotransfer) domain-containing protein